MTPPDPPRPAPHRSEVPERLRTRLSREARVSPDQVRMVRAPYRFCPVGAHADHQDGEVTGIALDRSLYLAWIPSPSPHGRVHLDSLDAGGTVDFRLDQIPGRKDGHWGNYARGAAHALATRHQLKRAIRGIVQGEMSPGGVSTSAALGVSCLLALERANGLEVSAVANVELDRRIENDFLGLKNGILDQSVILRARARHLFHLDCRTGEAQWHPAPDTMEEPSFVAFYSGVMRSLVKTGYNERVTECERAAVGLLQSASLPVPGRPKLRDVPRDVFDAHHGRLPEAEARRAAHYFGEMDRVRRATTAWLSGDLPRLGSIITETGRSSIELYECGSPELVRLYELLLEETAVLGARFSGAGFRGYCMALVVPGSEAEVVERVTERYARAFPARMPEVHAHVCRWADGAQPDA